LLCFQSKTGTQWSVRHKVPNGSRACVLAPAKHVPKALGSVLTPGRHALALNSVFGVELQHETPVQWLMQAIVSSCQHGQSAHPSSLRSLFPHGAVQTVLLRDSISHPCLQDLESPIRNIFSSMFLPHELRVKKAHPRQHGMRPFDEKRNQVFDFRQKQILPTALPAA